MGGPGSYGDVEGHEGTWGDMRMLGSWGHAGIREAQREVEAKGVWGWGRTWGTRGTQGALGGVLGGHGNMGHIAVEGHKEIWGCRGTWGMWEDTWGQSGGYGGTWAMGGHHELWDGRRKIRGVP